MKVLVTGSEGLPGHAVVRMLEERDIPCLGVDLPAFDLTDANGIYACVEKYAPDTIVHCAGYPNSDKAESLPERCAALNGLGTLTVARAAVRVGAKMLFLSSPHVFPCVGDQPYAPGDAYGPRYVFGMSKVQGEDAVRSLLTRYYIVRTDWLYGPGKQDFLRPLLKAAQEKRSLRVASDQFSSPTYARDLARVLCDLIDAMIMKKTGTNCRILPLPTADLPGSPRRPLNCRMEAELPIGIAPMPSVEEGLDRCLRDMNLV